MSIGEDNSKHLAKNTIILYCRMIFTMAIGFYTTRVVLKALGSVDYGLYNIVGGIVYMLAFIQSALSNSTARFISCAIGKNNSNEIKKTFHSTLTIHIIMGLILLLVFETIGIYFFYTLNIPDSRLEECMFIYQITVISIILSIITNPYQASIIAYERISIFAYFSILDVLLKLVIVFALSFSDSDKLVLYGSLIFFTNILNYLIIIIYCNTKLKNIRFGICYSFDSIKDITQFLGWSIIGNFSNILRFQGINYLLNIFCGPTINAARGLSFQVQSIILRFIQNIQTAINPQIYKSYANKDLDYLNKLVNYSSRFSFFVIFIISFPLYVETEYFMKLWLGEIPIYTVEFVKLLLIGTILEAFINPLEIASNATSKIKYTQIFVSFIYFIYFLTCYVLLKLSFSPNSVFILNIFFNIIIIIGRVYIIKEKINLDLANYSKVTFFNITKILIPCTILFHFLTKYMNTNSHILHSITALILSLIIVFLLGLNHKEKEYIYLYIKNRFNK